MQIMTFLAALQDSYPCVHTLASIVTLLVRSEPGKGQITYCLHLMECNPWVLTFFFLIVLQR